MAIACVGSPPSRNCTVWVKWSSVVHVTVVPDGTVMSAAANLYDAGRSTDDVATGDPAGEPAAELPHPAATNAARAAARTTGAIRFTVSRVPAPSRASAPYASPRRRRARTPRRRGPR